MYYQQTIEEGHEWAKILQCSSVADLNEIVEHGDIGELIRVSEALHEKEIAKIADDIARQVQEKRIVLIAGPSSSGKTSFAQRLRVQLRVLGITPVSISMDNYFLNRDEAPRKPNGDYDFESVDCLDLKLFNEQLQRLIAGEKVQVPYYNFLTGKREFHAEDVLQVTAQEPLVIEGIHALNDKVSSTIPREKKYKIYVSSLTPLYLTDNVRLSTTQARLFRRMVRDYRTRGYSAAQTIKAWPSVIEGEQKYIYQFQNDGDATFNTSLLYELGVLKKYATYILAEISPKDEAYPKAQELLEFCRYFKAIFSEKDIPNTSILREFIGGSCFDVG